MRFNDLECMLQKLEDIDAETDAMRHELYAQWNSVARKDSDNSSSDLDYRIQVIRKYPTCFVNCKFIRFSKNIVKSFLLNERRFDEFFVKLFSSLL